MSSFRAVILAAGDPALGPGVSGEVAGGMRLDASVLEPPRGGEFTGRKGSTSGLDWRLIRELGLWARLASEHDTALGSRRKAVDPQPSK